MYRSMFLMKRVAALAVGLAACGAALAQPANDTCADATPLVLDAPLAGTTVGAQLDLPVSCFSDFADVWYSFTPGVTGPYVFSVSGESNFDLSLAVLSGCEFPIGEFGCAPGAADGARLELTLFAGSTIVVRVGSSNEQTFTLTGQNAPPPSNDECQGAIPLELGEAVPSNNLSATTTLELDDGVLCSSMAPGLAGGADVFFSFTPEFDGFYDFSTCGAEIDTVVSIHTACPVTAANAIACNDNAPLPACPDSFDTHSSHVSGVALTGGQTYYVRVSSVRIFNPFTGELEEPGRGRFEIIVLDGVPPTFPENDTCANADALNPDSATFGSTVNATSDIASTCGSGDSWDVWYEFTSELTERTSFEFTILPGSFNAQATISVYDACGGDQLLCQAFNPFSNPDMTVWIGLDPGQAIKIRIAGQGGTQDDFNLLTSTGGPAADNVSCETAQPVAAGVPVTADTAGADSDLAGPCGFADIYPLWYSFTAEETGYYRIATDFPVDPEGFDRTTLVVYRDCNAEPITCTQRGDQFSTNPAAAALAVFIQAGDIIFARVSYEAPTRAPMEFSVSGPLPPPPPVTNDTCATAETIGSMPFSAQVDVTLATPDQDVCAFAGEPPFPTPGGIWFQFTPEVRRVFRGVAGVVGGEGARISVFTGPCAALTQINCPTDGFPGDAGVVLEAGVTHSFLVSLATSPEGDLDEIPYGTTFDISFIAPTRPANDHCDAAERISSTETTINVNTLPADADTPMPSCIGFDGALQNAVWYTFTTSTAGTVTVSGFGSNIQEGLYSPGGALFSGSCDELTEVACDSPLDGFFITREFQFEAELQAGVTYYLVVGSWARAQGGDTRIEFGYTGDLGCAADFNSDGVVNSQDFFDFLTAFFKSAPNADFNADGTVNSQDFFDFLTVFFTC